MARSFTTTANDTTTPLYKLPISSTLSPAAISISAWYFPTSTNYTNVQSVYVRRQSAGGTSMHFIGQLSASAHLAYQVVASATISVNPGSGSVTANQWAHTGLSYDSVNGLKTFLNGASDGTAAANGALASTNTQAPFFGGDPDFNLTAGQIIRLADIAVWNTNLSAFEFAALAKGARPGNIRPGSLIAWLPLDGLVSTEPDLSGKAFNGTPQGSPVLAFGPPFMQFTPRWPTNPPFIVPTSAVSSFLAARAMRANLAYTGFPSM